MGLQLGCCEFAAVGWSLWVSYYGSSVWVGRCRAAVVGRLL